MRELSLAAWWGVGVGLGICRHGEHPCRSDEDLPLLSLTGKGLSKHHMTAK